MLNPNITRQEAWVRFEVINVSASLYMTAPLQHISNLVAWFGHM
jgi:hypothetical protein